MRVRLVVVSALTIMVWTMLAAGCASNPQTLPRYDMTVDGLARSYHMFVPAEPPEGPMPLVVGFHGGGGAGEQFPQQSRFQALAEAEGVILAFPQGHLLSGNEGEWQLNTTAESRHDINFVAAMIDEISAAHSVDATRVYATGYSLGSMFSYEVACQMSDRFAAIASYAGTMPVSPADCNPQRFAPLMHIHGTDDYIISYNQTWDWKAWAEVGPMRPIPQLLEYWRDKYGCENESESSASSSTHIVYDQCEQDARVEHHRIGGLGHEWPASINGVSTHQVIWNFLSAFTL